MIHTELLPLIKDLAGGNVFLGAAPEGTKAPFITWNVISTQYDDSFCGHSVEGESNIQIDCYARTGMDAVMLRETVMSAIAPLTPHNVSTSESIDTDTTLGRSMIECMIWL